MKEVASTRSVASVKKPNDWLLGPVFDILFLQFGYFLLAFFLFDMFLNGQIVKDGWAVARPNWLWLVVVEAHLMAPYAIILSRSDLRQYCATKKNTFIWAPLALLVLFIGILFISIKNELFKHVAGENYILLWTVPLIIFEFRHFSAQNYGILSFYRKAIRTTSVDKKKLEIAKKADKYFVAFSMMVLLPLCWVFSGSSKLRIFELKQYQTPWLSDVFLAIACFTFAYYIYLQMKSETLTVPRFLFSGTIFTQVGLATMISQTYSGIFFIVTHCVAALAISALAMQPITKDSRKIPESKPTTRRFFTLSTFWSTAFLFGCGFLYLSTYKAYLIEPHITCRGTFVTDNSYGAGHSTSSLLVSASWWGFMLWLYVMHYYYESFLYRNNTPVAAELKERFSIDQDRI